jgi:hypothetical protein
MFFTDQRRTQRKKGYFCCGEIRQFVEDCPNKPKPKDIKKARRVRRQGLTTIKTWDDSSSEEEAHHKRNDYKSLSSSFHICLMMAHCGRYFPHGKR